MKKIKKIFFWKPWLSGLTIGLVLALGITVSAVTITGTVDEVKALFGQEGISLGGNVAETGGICNGSEPATTMCNVDINNLDVTTALEIDGTLTIEGMEELHKNTTTFNSASTTLTYLAGPTATSTLIWSALVMDVSSTTAMTITFARSTTNFASTTPIGEHTIGSSTQATLMATTSPVIFSPNENLVITARKGTLGGGNGTFTSSGHFNAIWRLTEEK
jgi:hypothetical protein